MLRIDERRLAAGSLRFGYYRESEGGFTGLFGTVDFDYSASGHAAYTCGDIEGN